MLSKRQIIKYKSRLTLIYKTICWRMFSFPAIQN